MRFRGIALTLALVLAPGFGVAQESLRSVAVEGVGRVTAVPDMAEVSIGVRSEAREAARAMAAASEATAAVLATISNAGVAPEDVQTTHVGLDPRWQHSNDGSPPRVTGYIASNMLSVRVRALDDLGGLLDAVVSAGANSVNGITFGVADRSALENEARAKAVEDAAAKARVLASAAGASVGDVLSLAEGSTGGGPVPMMEAAFSDRASVPIAAGQIEIVVSVRAVFALED